MKTVTLYEHTYNNGNKVEVTNKGVVIWDASRGLWVMDASTMNEDSIFAVAEDLQQNSIEHGRAVGIYNSLYPKNLAKKKVRKKNGRSTKRKIR